MQYIGLNGKILPLNKGVVLANDRGLLLGDGLFETIYYKDQEIEDFMAHWQRLERGLAIFEISSQFSSVFIEQQIMEILTMNQLLGKTASIRLTITRGLGKRGLQIPDEQFPTWIIQINEYHRNSSPLVIGFSQHCHPGSSALSTIKHLGYQLSILGRLEARKKGLDDVLFINKMGEIVSTTAANIFVKLDGEYVTPPLDSGCLPGIKRAKVIKQLEQNGEKIAIRPILSRELVEKAEEVFLTNSLINIQSVKEIIRI